MFEKLTERARKAMSLAREEAQRLKSETIEPEHLLLGIVKEGGGVAARVFKDLKVDPDQIRQEIEKLLTPSTSLTVTLGPWPWSSRGKRAIERSGEEARSLGHDVIGTEHLLLGLLKENEGIAVQVLNVLGLNLGKVRDKVLEILGAPVASSPQGPPRGPLIEKLTDGAVKAMGLASQEAQRHNSEFIGTEHILLGVIQEGGGITAKVLKSANVDSERIRQEIEELTAPSTSPVLTFGQLRWSPRVTQAVKFAVEEASSLGHSTIGTDHLILGLLRAKEGIGGQVLLKLGLNLDEVRAWVAAAKP